MQRCRKDTILGLEGNVVYTDADGFFHLDQVPAGNVKLVIDGLTASNAPSGAFYPEMVLDLTIEVGYDNTVMGSMGTREAMAANEERQEVYLPRLQTSILQTVSGSTTTDIGVDAASAPNLTDEQRAHLKLEVQPGTLIDADGNVMSGGQVGISTVPPELVRDMLPPGVLQHTFDITIQAPGVAAFATPLQITFPNVFNAVPGEKLNFLSFDHTTGRLVIEGAATVSADGRSVTTDPGQGITKPGWHGVIRMATLIIRAQLTPDCWPILTDDLILDFLIRVQLQGSMFYEAYDFVEDIFKTLLKNSTALTTTYIDLQHSRTITTGTWDAINRYSHNPANILFDDFAQDVKAFSDNQVRLFDALGRQTEVLAQQLINDIPRLEDCVEQHFGPEAFFELAAAIAQAPITAFNLSASALGFPPLPSLSGQRSARANSIAFASDRLVATTDTVEVPLWSSRMSAIAEHSNLWARQVFDLGQAYSEMGAVFSSVGGGDSTDARLVSQLLDALALVIEHGRAYERFAGSFENYVEIIETQQSSLKEEIGKVADELSLPQANIWVLVEPGGLPIRALTNSNGETVLSLAPNSSASVIAGDPRRGLRDQKFVTIGPAGSTTTVDLLPLPAIPSDVDGDGLLDELEDLVGTKRHSSDTDADGLSDFAEIRAGLDPLGGRAVPTGIVAALPLQGQAKAVTLAACRTFPAPDPNML